MQNWISCNFYFFLFPAIFLFSFPEVANCNCKFRKISIFWIFRSFGYFDLLSVDLLSFDLFVLFQISIFCQSIFCRSIFCRSIFCRGTSTIYFSHKRRQQKNAFVFNFEQQENIEEMPL
jgi:hypothetical protein